MGFFQVNPYLESAVHGTWYKVPTSFLKLVPKAVSYYWDTDVELQLLKKKIFKKTFLHFLSTVSNTKRSLFTGNNTDVFIPTRNFILHIEVPKICQLSVIFLKVYKQQDKVLHLLQEVY